MKQHGQLLGEHAIAVNPKQASPVSLALSLSLLRHAYQPPLPLYSAAPALPLTECQVKLCYQGLTEWVNRVWIFQVKVVIATSFSLLSANND